ncbi:hypothetical protein BN440_2455 [Erwinia amylovora MR1]|nr:hypothetical protein BN440_2455 [Erwinia amylovora MR1]
MRKNRYQHQTLYFSCKICHLTGGIGAAVGCEFLPVMTECYFAFSFDAGQMLTLLVQISLTLYDGEWPIAMDTHCNENWPGACCMKNDKEISIDQFTADEKILVEQRVKMLTDKLSHIASKKKRKKSSRKQNAW